MNILFSLLVLVLGVLNILIPETMAMFGERWKYRNAEPSELNIFFTRIGGVVLIIAAIFLFFTT